MTIQPRMAAVWALWWLAALPVSPWCCSLAGWSVGCCSGSLPCWLPWGCATIWRTCRLGCASACRWWFAQGGLIALGDLPAMALSGGLAFQVTGWVLFGLLLLAGVWWINLFNFMDGIEDRNSVGSGKRVSVRVDYGGVHLM